MLMILGIVAGILVLAAAVILIIAAGKPDTFRVSRTLAISATPEKIFPLINDYKNWTQWSPYENRDPGMKRTYSGPASGPGAVYAWDGNKNVGSGRMETVDTAPPNKVIIKLDFFTPFEAHNVAEFTLTPNGANTDVTWSMHGPAPFFAKIMHTVINIDKMVGNDFAAGLANMKGVAERPAIAN